MARSYDWQTPFLELKEWFPKVDDRLLKAAVLEHKDGDLNAAAYFILNECMQYTNDPDDGHGITGHSQDGTVDIGAESSQAMDVERVHEAIDEQSGVSIDSVAGSNHACSAGIEGDGSTAGIEVVNPLEAVEDSAIRSHHPAEGSENAISHSIQLEPVDMKAFEGGEDCGSNIPEPVNVKPTEGDVTVRDPGQQKTASSTSEGDVIVRDPVEQKTASSTGVDVSVLGQVVAETLLEKDDLKKRFLVTLALFEDTKGMEAKVEEAKARAGCANEQTMLQVAELQQAQSLTRDANEQLACELMAERNQLKREEDVLQSRLKKVAAEKEALQEVLAEVTANLQARISELQQEEMVVQEEIRQKKEAADGQLAVEKAKLEEAFKYRDELEGQKKECDEAKAFLELSGRRVDKCQADIQGLAEQVEQLKWQVDNALLIESSMLTSQSGYVKFLGLVPGEASAANTMTGSLSSVKDGGSSVHEGEDNAAAKSAGFQLGISASQMYSSSTSACEPEDAQDASVAQCTKPSSSVQDLTQQMFASMALITEGPLPAASLSSPEYTDYEPKNEVEGEAMEVESRVYEPQMRLFPGESVLADRPMVHFLQRKQPHADPDWEVLDHPSGPSSLGSSSTTNSTIGH